MSAPLLLLPGLVGAQAQAQWTNTSRYGTLERPCLNRPTWNDCPLQPHFHGERSERALFTRVCTAAADGLEETAIG